MQAPSPPGSSDTGVRRVRRRSRGAPERFACWAIIAAGAIGAGLSHARPTGNGAVDVVWCAAFGALIGWAGSRSRRWPWFWLAGVAAAAALGSWWILPALVALVLAFASSLRRRRSRLLGAVIGALAVQTLLRLPAFGFHGLPSLVVAVAVGPVLWSAYDRCHRIQKRRIRRGALIAAALMIVALAGAGVAAITARGPLQSGVDASRGGLDSLQGGDAPAASQQFERARGSFARADRRLSAPWALPGRLLPIVGQHLDTLDGVAQSGQTLASAAAVAASSADYQQLRGENGQIDLAVVEQMQKPVKASADALRAARERVDEVGSSWLVGPVARPLADFSRQIDRTLPEAELASQGLDVAPGLLGGDGERRYLVLFTTPSESRSLGGFIGAYGVLTAKDGKLTFAESGPIAELNNAPGADNRTLDPDSEFGIRYGRYHLTKYLQNLSAGPDLPEDADITRQLYRQTTGQDIDGVIVADPYGLAALLKLTGPVTVEGMAEPLSSENAVSYLLRDQYLQYDGVNDERKDKLQQAARATFDALTERSLPSLREVGDDLGPAMHQGRLMFTVFDPDEQAFLDALGTTGRMVMTPGHDYLSVRTSNAQANKIDSFLQRQIDYDARVTPATGAVEATARVALTNSAPTSGLPDYVLGDGRERPRGTTAMYLSLYTPLAVTSATVDGVSVGVEPQHELGSPVYSLIVAVPAGATVTVEFQLTGQVAAGPDYHLDLLNQPMANPDRSRVSIASAVEGEEVVAADGLHVGEGRAMGEATLDTDEHFTVWFARTDRR